MFRERSLKRVEGSIRERKAEAQGNEVSGLFLAFLCTCGTKWVLRCCGLSTDLRVGSYSDPSTAVTAHPRSAKYRALRPAPQARSNTVPGVSFSAISTTSMVAASSLPWSPDRYLSSQPAISIAQSLPLGYASRRGHRGASLLQTEQAAGCRNRGAWMFE